MEITAELVLVVVAWFAATLTTWGLITYTLKYVKRNGLYIDEKLKQFALQTTTIQKQVVEIKTALPDLSQGIQIDTLALVEGMKPALQDIFKGSFQGLKGAEMAQMRGAAKLLKENMPEEDQVPFLEAIANGDPQAMQLAQFMKGLAKMMPSLADKNPIVAEYADTILQLAPNAYNLMQQRRGNVHVQGSSQGEYKPGLR